MKNFYCHPQNRDHMEKMISDDSVFRYIYAHWDLWIPLTNSIILQ